MWQWIKNIFTSSWFKTLIQYIIGKLESILVEIGKETLEKIKAKIVEVAQEDIPNKEKLKKVFDYIKALMPTLKDSAINLLIETLVSELKGKGVI